MNNKPNTTVTPYFYYENLPSMDYSSFRTNHWLCYFTMTQLNTEDPVQARKKVPELHLINIIFEQDNENRITGEKLGHLFQDFLNEPGRTESDLLSTFSDPQKAKNYLEATYSIIDAPDEQGCWHVSLKITDDYNDQPFADRFEEFSTESGSVPLFSGFVEYLNMTSHSSEKQLFKNVLPLLEAATKSVPDLLEDIIGAAVDAAISDKEYVTCDYAILETIEESEEE